MTGMQLLPPPPYACHVCAHEHSPEQPHNPQSLYWQTARQMARMPAATWAEAMEHCPEDVKAQWTEKLTAIGVDLDKPGGQP